MYRYQVLKFRRQEGSRSEPALGIEERSFLRLVQARRVSGLGLCARSAKPGKASRLRCWRFGVNPITLNPKLPTLKPLNL